MSGSQGGPIGRPILTPDELTAATAAGLSEDEGRAALSTGMDFGRYAAMREVRTITDWERMRSAEREQAEHDRLKAAIREALDERERNGG